MLSPCFGGSHLPASQRSMALTPDKPPLSHCKDMSATSGREPEACDGVKSHKGLHQPQGLANMLLALAGREAELQESYGHEGPWKRASRRWCATGSSQQCPDFGAAARAVLTLDPGLALKNWGQASYGVPLSRQHSLPKLPLLHRARASLSPGMRADGPMQCNSGTP